jgi:hypothetical protein
MVNAPTHTPTPNLVDTVGPLALADDADLYSDVVVVVVIVIRHAERERERM